MSLITLNNAALAFGHHKLLDKVDFSLESGDIVGLIGRNGAGKSSLLKVMARQVALDDGKIYFQDGIKTIYLPQEPELDGKQTIQKELLSAVSGYAFVAKYYDLLDRHADLTAEEEHEFHEISAKMDHDNLWNLEVDVQKVIDELQIDPELPVDSLSGGLHKKVAILKAILAAPDVLLMDEPTNHLDVATINWLERLITNFKGAVILITHDRKFLDNTVNKIVELDRGYLRVFPNKYSQYVENKQVQLEQESKINHEFDKFLAQEEVWIRKGIQARRTRNEGRVRRLEELRKMRSDRRAHLGKVNMQVESSDSSSKIIAEINHLSFAYPNGQYLIKDFSAVVKRGDKIGLIGNNGAGKSTLLKILLGDLPDYTGEIKLARTIEVAYFDQLRNQLDENQTIADTITQGQDHVMVNGRKRHIASYLEDFLFEPARFRSPVSSLSGGERNRLLLARIFSKPANVLVLDEPTNDLDIETIEILEELVSNFNGTVFIVSHDRSFLDNIVTQSWVFEGSGKVTEYHGGFSDDILQILNKSEVKSIEKNAIVENNTDKTNKNKNKLTYKEKLELEKLPEELAKIEEQQKELQKLLSDPDFYVKNKANEVLEVTVKLTNVDNLFIEMMERWENLVNKQ